MKKQMFLLWGLIAVGYWTINFLLAWDEPMIKAAIASQAIIAALASGGIIVGLWNAHQRSSYTSTLGTLVLYVIFMTIPLLVSSIAYLLMWFGFVGVGGFLYFLNSLLLLYLPFLLFVAIGMAVMIPFFRNLGQPRRDAGTAPPSPPSTVSDPSGIALSNDPIHPPATRRTGSSGLRFWAVRCFERCQGGTA